MTRHIDGNAGHDRGEERRTHRFAYAAAIGLYAGFIWGAIRWFAVLLNFTSVSQAFLMDPFVRRAELVDWNWQLAGYAAFVVMSVVAALVYLVLLGRLAGPWPGILFGATWWVALYIGAGPYIGIVPPLTRIDMNSYVTDACLFIAWGVFIGYSIAFEFRDESKQERMSRGKGKGGAGGSGERKDEHERGHSEDRTDDRTDDRTGERHPSLA